MKVRSDDEESRCLRLEAAVRNRGLLTPYYGTYRTRVHLLLHRPFANRSTFSPISIARFTINISAVPSPSSLTRRHPRHYGEPPQNDPASQAHSHSPFVQMPL